MRNPKDSARKGSQFKLIFSLCFLLMSLFLAISFISSDSAEGNLFVPWLIIPLFLFIGVSGTYTGIQELRGNQKDADEWETPKCLKSHLYVPEHCYSHKVSGYYLLRPTITPGCAGNALIWLSIILAAGVTILLAGEEDYRDGINGGLEFAPFI